MGRQINFYLSPLDERDFLLALQKLGPYSIYRTSSATPSERVEIQENRIVVREPIDALNVAIVPATKGIEFSIVNKPALGGSRIDKEDSELISFSRCRILKPGEIPTIGPGRVWYSEKARSGDPKSKHFVSWARSVLNWCRHNYIKDVARGRYLGPDAAKLLSAGNIRTAP